MPPKPTVGKEAIEDIYPLSPLQEGMLFHYLYSPGLDFYFQQIKSGLEGRLDTARLRMAWQQVVDRHPPLRTAFVWKQRKKPLQAVYRRVELPWQETDLRGLDPAAQQARLAAHLAADLERGCDLARAPLLRVALFLLAPERFHMVWSFHHVILDGWSIAQLLDEVLLCYRRLGGDPVGLPERRPFSQYVAWLQKQDPARAESFWRRELAGFTTPTPLPAERPGSKSGAEKARGDAELRAAAPAAVFAPVAAFARQSQLTLNTLVQAAWALLLARYTGARDVVFGAVVSGRSAPIEGIADMIGMMINTQPVRAQVAHGERVSGWLRAFQTWLSAAREHEHVALVDVGRWSAVPAGTHLFNTLTIFENFPQSPAATREQIGFRIAGVDSHESTSYPLTLMVRATAQLELRLFFETGRFETTAMARLLAHFQNLLLALPAAAESPLASLDPLSPAERRQLLATWNDSARPEPPAGGFLELLAAQVAARPESTAVAALGPDGPEQLSYGELSRQARRLARGLRRAGAGRETVVAVALAPGLELAVALVGVLEAGAAYLPLDPAYPQERRAYMLEDSGARLVLTEVRPSAAPGEPGEPAPAPPPGEALAYTIYTSGSTGRPKGVQISHRALANFLLAMAERPGLGAGRRLLSVTSLSFDIFGLELYLPLAVGATVELVDRATAANGELLLRRLAGVDVLQATPSTWRLLLAAGWTGGAGLVALCGGEPLPAPLAAQLGAATAATWNLYGPTETTIWSAVERVGVLPLGEGAVVSIGRPIANTRIHVVDPALWLQPVEVAGEVVIGGMGLARGYLGRPRLSAERFVPDPFDGGAGARLYRTGDLALRREDGRLAFLGRIDHQVKLRGYRIELGEIESRLAEHPRVRAAVVKLWGEGEAARLAAYVVPAAPAPSPAELREHLLAGLPEFMVPVAFELLEALPLTPNGKIDRGALAIPERPRREIEVEPEERGFLEEQLAVIWADVLQLERVAAADHFFELGGHSLLAVQLVARVRQHLGLELPLAVVFEAPRLRELAARLETLRGEGAAALPALVRVPRETRIPLSFSQFRLWFLDQWEPGTPAYNLRRGFHVRGPLDAPALAAAWLAVARRHEGLRTRFVGHGGGPEQVIETVFDLPFYRVDLRGLTAAEREVWLERLMAIEARWSFRLDRLPLWRAVLVHLTEQSWRLLLNFHHVITDGWSFGILFRDLAACYAVSTEGAAPLPELPLQYADYAAWQRGWLEGEGLAAKLAYWRKTLEGGGSPPLDLPTDRPRPARQTFRGSQVAIDCGAELSGVVAAFGRREAATPFMVLLAALDVLLGRYASRRDVSVGTFSAGRVRPELEGILGFFVNTLVLRVRLEGNPSLRELSSRVRQAALGAYTHQEVPFEKILEELDLERDLGRTPLFQVMLVLQNLPRRAAAVAGVVFEAAESQGLDRANFDLTLWLTESTQGIVGHLEYNVDLFDRATIERLGEHYKTLLGAFAGDPARRIAGLPLLGPEQQAQVLVGWNDTPAAPAPELPVDALFARCAARAPAAVAVRHAGRSLRYGELATAASRLAERLRALGVGPERVVAICLPRSLEMVVALLGVLETGGAYLPLDPQNPRRRLAELIADARALAVLGDAASLEALGSEVFAPGGVARVVVDLPSLLAAAAAPVRPRVPRDLDQLAYVIYTSGSTGRPKGVGVAHRALAAHTADACLCYGVSAGDRCLQFASLSFDASAEEIYPALLSGAELVLRGEEMMGSPAEFFAACETAGITVLNLPTAYWHELAAAAELLPASVRVLIIGGERARVDRLRGWLGQRAGAPRLYNTYGPTEATVVTARWLADPSVALGGEVPIGRALGHARIYVLDLDLGVLPPGVPGELAIAGAGLARGYLGRPAVTAAVFVPDPFGGAGERLYRSGDRARWRGDGQLECLGRFDHQVKLRGFRIELGEVEASLVRHPEVAEAVAVVRRDEGDAEPRLVAYVVPAPGAAPGAAQLRAHLRELLPEPMVPAAFVVLAELPKTSAGKLDRRALPAPDRSRPELDPTYAAPRSDSEAALAAVAGELLGLERVGIFDSFFDLGGHSLLATQYRARIEETFELELPLRAIFERPTVAGLAALVEEIILQELEAEEGSHVEVA